MPGDTVGRAARIAAQNDMVRITFTGGRIVLSPAIQALDSSLRATIMRRMQEFDQWLNEEHDFGTFQFNGYEVVFEFTYQSPSSKRRLRDPAADERSIRTVTLMLMSEYLAPK